MNKILKLLCCPIFVTMLVLCGACKDESRAPKPGGLTLDLNSREGIRKAIRLISTPENWTQARFDTINLAISSLAYSGEIDQDMDEDKEFLADLFSSSALCLEHKVDSVFRQPVYNGYDQMKSDLIFLQQYLPKFLEIGVIIEPKNPSLEKVAELFAEYDDRLKKSKSSFWVGAVYLKAYPYSEKSNYYKNAVDKIKSDEPKAYWTTYFSHNKEIVTGLNAFPSRLSSARTTYYDKLEEKIEKIANEENFSKEELEAVETTFYNMATGYNQNAIKKLGKFREEYKPIQEETIEQ